MKNFIIENSALAAGILVAFLSFLSSLFNFMKDRNIEAKQIKRIKQFTEVYKELPNDSQAKKNFEVLINQLSDKLLIQHTRKVNSITVSAVIIIALLGGGVSFLLASVANNTAGFISVLFWVLFGCVTIFTIALSATGWATRYNNASRSKDNP